MSAAAVKRLRRRHVLKCAPATLVKKIQTATLTTLLFIPMYVMFKQGTNDITPLIVS